MPLPSKWFWTSPFHGEDYGFESRRRYKNSSSSPVGLRCSIWDAEIECSNHSYSTKVSLFLKNKVVDPERKLRPIGLLQCHRTS